MHDCLQKFLPSIYEISQSCHHGSLAIPKSIILKYRLVYGKKGFLLNKKESLMQ